jgi:hypothetical protein
MRFKVGDIVKLVVARTTRSLPFLNEEFEIVQVGPFQKGELYFWYGDYTMSPSVANADYALLVSGNRLMLVMDWQLAKLNPDEEPAAFIRESKITTFTKEYQKA